jgi:hypothetical protein
MGDGRQAVIPFEPGRDGTVIAQFVELEAELICDLAGQIGELLAGSVPSPDSHAPDEHSLGFVGIGGSESISDDPAIARLLPNAYADDVEASTVFRRLTEHSLADRKVANARIVITGLLAADGAQFELDAEAQQAWIRTFTDIRLVLAARLGIETDDDLGRQDTTETRVMRDVYDWLAALQTMLLDAMEA